jgi:protein-S-isoprenylcysteine O-methyltransferase Ste14
MYKSILSGFLLFVFGVSYLYKLYVLKKDNKINANVLGKGDKDVRLRYIEILLRTTTFTWMSLWLFCIIFNRDIAELRLGYLGEINTEIFGLIITAIGVVFFELAIFFMKSSWRVGVDRETKTDLITDGIYKYSRNPAFVGFDMMFVGLFLTYTNISTFLVMCLNLIAIHLQILQEEKYLKESFGDKYDMYLEATSRYFNITHK